MFVRPLYDVFFDLRFRDPTSVLLSGVVARWNEVGLAGGGGKDSQRGLRVRDFAMIAKRWSSNRP